LYRKSTGILCSITLSENRAVYEIMWINSEELDGLRMTIKCGTCALHAGSTGIQRHTQNMKYLLHFGGKIVCRSAAEYYIYTYIACLLCYISWYLEWL